MLECVINISEGRRLDVIDRLAEIGDALDVHVDADHNRSVFTLIGEERPRLLAEAAVVMVDLRGHDGAHPRLGAVDVVPFVPLHGSTLDDARLARDRFGTWFGQELGVPCFRYGPERSLPEVRRRAFVDLAPDFPDPGDVAVDAAPIGPHRTAGATAVGARPLLIAYNVWLRDPDLAAAKALAREIRQPGVRALGLQVGEGVQVSMNLIDPRDVGPATVYDWLAERIPVERAELVGLAPAFTLEAIDPDRWDQLDLAPERTIEGRLAQRGIVLTD